MTFRVFSQTSKSEEDNENKITNQTDLTLQLKTGAVSQLPPFQLNEKNKSRERECNNTAKVRKNS